MKADYERLYRCPKCGGNLFASVEDTKALEGEPYAWVMMICESEAYEKDQEDRCGFITRMELMVRAGHIDWPEQEVLEYAFNPGDEFFHWDADSHRRNGFSQNPTDRKSSDRKPDPVPVPKYGRRKQKRPSKPDLRTLYLGLVYSPDEPYEKSEDEDEFYIRMAHPDDPKPDFVGPFVDREHANKFWLYNFIRLDMLVFCWAADLPVFGPMGIGGRVISNQQVDPLEFANFCERFNDMPEVYEDSFWPDFMVDGDLLDIFYVAQDNADQSQPSPPQKDDN